jgi:LytR cell envelope-related transcriptional attenuator
MTGLERARQRRRQRAIAVLVVASIMVFGGFGFALAYWEGWVGSTNAEPTCTPTVSTPPQGKFTVNVYNASRKAGAAGGLSESLRSRGFLLGNVGNDPYKKRLTGVGEIRYGAAGEALAKRHLAPLLPDAELVLDGRTGTSVDVAIGEQMNSVPTVSATSASGEC